MAQQPTNDAALREEEERQRGLTSENATVDREPEAQDADKGWSAAEQEVVAPNEPEGPEEQREPLSWTERGDMVSQQTSAMEWVHESHERRLEREAEQAPDQSLELTDEQIQRAQELADAVNARQQDHQMEASHDYTMDGPSM
jgi:hypothetical protein